MVRDGFYHDGRFADLREVIRHYDRLFGLKLSGGGK
jgi:cytochrome c peroxidase